MITTDILIIGAGPTGLFAVFEAGLLKLKCHLIDALPQIGGQCSEIYPKKPIYDIPGFPEILAGELTDNLMEQCRQFQPGFTLGERAETMEKQADGTFIVTTNKGTKHQASVVAIAGGLGSFEPRKPPISNISNFEDHGVEYIIKDPEIYRDKNIVIAGGGDSALDWSIFLSKIASKVTLIHRRNEFRGALDSVEKVQELKNKGLVNLVTPAEVTSILGHNHVTGVTVKKSSDSDEEFNLMCDHFIPLFGLSPKLGPIANWGLNIEKKTIEVDTEKFETNQKGIYAVGDICTYPGKLKLILSGFHEGALAARACFKLARPNEKYRFEFTTASKTLKDRLGKK